MLNRNKGFEQRHSRSGTPAGMFISTASRATNVCRQKQANETVVGGLLSSAEFRLCEVEYKCAFLILRRFNQLDRGFVARGV